MSAPARPGAPTTARPATARATAARPARRGATRSVRGGVLAEVALVPVVLSYACAVVLAGVVPALASGTAPGGEPGLGQALAVGVPLWLAAHLVPLQLQGVPLSAVPLAPAIGVTALVAATARRGVRRLGGRWPGSGVPVVATAAAAHAACGVLAAALLTPDAVVDASPALAGVVCGLLAAVAALAGVARPCGLLARRDRLPTWALRGLGAARVSLALLLMVGAALLTAALVAHAPTVAAVFTRLAPDAGSGAGLALLTLGYLPNAVVAAVSWVLGPGVAVGAVSASPTAAMPGLLPPLPLAAVLPSGPPPSWAGLTFAAPLAVGSVVGWLLAPQAGGASARLRSVGLAATTVALVLGALAGLAGGRLGTGPFDPVAVPAGPVTLAAFAWIAVPGAVVALLAVPGGGPRRPRRAPSTPTPRTPTPTTPAPAGGDASTEGDVPGAGDAAGPTQGADGAGPTEMIDETGAATHGSDRGD